MGIKGGVVMGFIEQVFDEVATKVFDDVTGRQLETAIVVFAAFMASMQIIAALCGVNVWSAL
ncbi:hypothetical protein [Periweissella ghanensis]|uniref:Uncharacterized protein n=2 Tax=Periweissella ghanensis TaxID=467997 RepID=A0ABN8BT38_9LACO|nr:hypothetical protein [Periweissella ghanensis]MCM0601324.1 hypothetical protein [Periweissella ghanensis]CAH0419387.1 hypothetical protein WGH24286_01837 [Periweissella ghanensis]